MNWTNLLVWNLQISLLVAAAAVLTAAFRLRPAPARLLFRRVLLAACLVLPAIQPWRRDIVMVERVPAAVPVVAAGPVLALPATPPAPRRISWPEAALWVLAAGVAFRMAKFGLGLVRLARYRRAARPLDPVPPAVDRVRWQLCVYPEMAISEEVSGPVTFGFLDPVILFPASFPGLDAEVQAAVACHELLHVRRRDWLFTAIEEMVRAVFWFHPAVWWVLGQIQLAREQSVDREVVRLAVARERYVDALLAFSGARQQLDLAPAPLFLRRRHLTARVAAIIKEADMSYKRLWYSLAACAGVLLVAGWLVCGSLPLKGAPQLATDGPGVKVTGVDRIMHRTPVEYPAEARNKGIEGTVLLDVVLAPDGTVADAAVIGGPMELRQAALSSVLKWHFNKEAAPRQQVSVEFSLAAMKAAAEAGPVVTPDRGVIGGVMGGQAGGVPRGVVGGVIGGQAGGAPRGEVGGVIGGLPAATAPPQQMLLQSVTVRGLSPEAEQELRSRLQLQDGQLIDNEKLQKAQQIVHQFDPKLWVAVGSNFQGLDAAISTQPQKAGVMFLIPADRSSTVQTGVQTNPLTNVPRKLHVDIRGLSPEATAELRQRLGLREDQVFDHDAFTKELGRISQIVKEFDPHLNSASMVGGIPRTFGPDGKLAPPPNLIESTLIIRPADMLQVGSAPPPLPPPPPGVQRIEVPGSQQVAKLKSNPPPVYPDLARQARLSGVVHLRALIGRDGKMVNLYVISGHPLLVPAAMEAAKAWEYEPTLVNGQPAEVLTQVDVNFTLK